LINNVLDFAKLERGEKKYRFEPVDLATLARETCETYQPHLEGDGFALRCDIPPQPLPVKADRDAISQVLVNLLSNAEKYGGEKKQIDLTAERNGNTVAIKVMDRGAGVPAGCEEKIFEQFFRAHDSLSSGIQGSGLGLTLARQIARAHGGDVTFNPRDGGGSCFTLRLPVTSGI
jgi:signal transduction histidine kinase